MQINELAPEFKTALPILEKIEAAGFEAYFVGGSVRDTLLGLPIHDVDIATSAYPAEVKALFERTVDTGIQHGTVMILDHGTGYEVTTFRTESGYQDYRRPDSVTFVRSLSEDLKRRDFTINALAMKADGEIIDLFDGLADLKHQQIRAVGIAADRFKEDALRMMRAVRFESQLGFDVTPQTQAAIALHAELLTKIAVERIEVEFVKLLQGQARQNGLTTFIQTGLFRYCPGLDQQAANLKQLSQLAPTQLANTTEAWLLLCASLQLTVSEAGHFLKRWKLSNELITSVQAGLRLLPSLLAGAATNWTLYEAGQQILADTLTVANILAPQQVLSDQFETAYQALPIKHKQELQINGQILLTQTQLTPGPQLGALLHELEQLVVAGTLKNDTAELLAWVRQK